MFNWLKKIIGIDSVLLLQKDWIVKDHEFKKPKRARRKGKYVADDKSTPNVNEAWVGGKAPKKKKKKKKKKTKKRKK